MSWGGLIGLGMLGLVGYGIYALVAEPSFREACKRVSGWVFPLLRSPKAISRIDG
jgi:hypothetical protein